MIMWIFLEDTLKKVGIPGNIINLIMQCVSTCSMKILWNGQKLDEFTPSRGLRQGDPLSPYLFLFFLY